MGRGAGETLTLARIFVVLLREPEVGQRVSLNAKFLKEPGAWHRTSKVQSATAKEAEVENVVKTFSLFLSFFFHGVTKLRSKRERRPGSEEATRFLSPCFSVSIISPFFDP